MVLNIKFALYRINITYLQQQMKNTIVHKAPGLLFSQCDYRGIEMKNLFRIGRFIAVLNLF